jgi:hypothetical protein
MSDLNPLLTCREVIDLLADDLHGELRLSLEFKFQLHLILCRSCRRFRRTYRHTVGMVHALRLIDEDLGLARLREELVQRILLYRPPAGVSDEGSR